LLIRGRASNWGPPLGVDARAPPDWRLGPFDRDRIIQNTDRWWLWLASSSSFSRPHARTHTHQHPTNQALRFPRLPNDPNSRQGPGQGYVYIYPHRDRVPGSRIEIWLDLANCATLRPVAILFVRALPSLFSLPSSFQPNFRLHAIGAPLRARTIAPPTHSDPLGRQTSNLILQDPACSGTPQPRRVSARILAL
jgi:hypothetical protein